MGGTQRVAMLCIIKSTWYVRICVCRCARSLPQDPGLVSAYFVGVTYQVCIRDNRGKGFKVEEGEDAPR